MIPKFLIEFPDFDNLEPISKLKDWQDTSLSLDGRPSFEKKDEDGHLYKLFVGYSLYSEHNIKVPGEKRYELLQDDNLIVSGNTFQNIYKKYKEIAKDNSANIDKK
ncbi:MAG: hypothetical protein J6N51_13315 [Selenomonas sp.]|nr:hypothetical protein [Selenomonas sp.]